METLLGVTEEEPDTAQKMERLVQMTEAYMDQKRGEENVWKKEKGTGTGL